MTYEFLDSTVGYNDLKQSFQCHLHEGTTSNRLWSLLLLLLLMFTAAQYRVVWLPRRPATYSVERTCVDDPTVREMERRVRRRHASGPPGGETTRHRPITAVKQTLMRWWIHCGIRLVWFYMAGLNPMQKFGNVYILYWDSRASRTSIYDWEVLFLAISFTENILII